MVAECDLEHLKNLRFEKLFLHFQSMVEQCAGDDPDVEINLGCLLYKVTLLNDFSHGLNFELGKKNKIQHLG